MLRGALSFAVIAALLVAIVVYAHRSSQFEQRCQTLSAEAARPHWQDVAASSDENDAETGTEEIRDSSFCQKAARSQETVPSSADVAEEVRSLREEVRLLRAEVARLQGTANACEDGH